MDRKKSTKKPKAVKKVSIEIDEMVEMPILVKNDSKDKPKSDDLLNAMRIKRMKTTRNLK